MSLLTHASNGVAEVTLAMARCCHQGHCQGDVSHCTISLPSHAGNGAVESCWRWRCPLLLSATGPHPKPDSLGIVFACCRHAGPTRLAAPLFSPHKRCPAVTRLCPTHVMSLDSPLVIPCTAPPYPVSSPLPYHILSHSLSLSLGYKKLPSAPLAISPSLHEFTPPDRTHPLLHLPLVPFARPCRWSPSSLTKFPLSYHRCFPSLVGTLLQP
jgi:hypothetical protein